jgi:hypothetical protein
LRAFRVLLARVLKPSKNDQRIEKENASAKTQDDRSWQGLPRYRSSLDDGIESSHRDEYAKVTTLLTSPELQVTYYCDTAGKVPLVPKMATGFAGLESFDIGNGDLSPEWGVDVVIKGGNLTYGPWADRQRQDVPFQRTRLQTYPSVSSNFRAELQKVFTPTTFTNAVATPRLNAGDERMHTALKVFVEFSEGATLRIPTRESSKVRQICNLVAVRTLNLPVSCRIGNTTVSILHLSLIQVFAPSVG